MEDDNLENKISKIFTQKIDRRTILKGSVLASTALIQTSFGNVLSNVSAPLFDKTDHRILGPFPSELGTRSPYENPKRVTSFTSSRTPLQDLYGFITPADLHFERHHSGIPDINPDNHELLIHGMVEKPMVFTLKDLKKFPIVSRICFLECSGNYRGGEETMTPQDIAGLTSQSEWTGVMLSTLFREVGISPKASWFLAEGADACLMTRSIPVKKGWDDAMIVFAQNGEAIRPGQGYPMRLLLPGWEGNASIKWIRRIEISDQPFMTREETSKYTEAILDGKVRQFSFNMDARSIITYPSYPNQIEKGWVQIRGIAWSGRGKINKVEVSTDAGKSWYIAELQGPILPKAHVSFVFLWKWDGRATEILSRATDETGYLQPTFKQIKEARGEETRYHYNSITSWQIKNDGTVWHKPD
jgi:sulfane dehydrogenase subunit SoxC